MDLHCPKCGEPWDNDTFHDIAAENLAEMLSDGHGVVKPTTYAKVAADFRVRGCEALGTSHGEIDTETDSTFGLTRSEAAATLYELLGDDMDGAAAELYDLFG